MRVTLLDVIEDAGDFAHDFTPSCVPSESKPILLQIDAKVPFGRSASLAEHGRRTPANPPQERSVRTSTDNAFLEELIDFFPEARARGSLRKIVAESKKVRDRLMVRAEKVLENFDADREANKLLRSFLLRSFGIAPESSVSTPAPSPSENSA